MQARSDEARAAEQGLGNICRISMKPNEYTPRTNAIFDAPCACGRPGCILPPLENGAAFARVLERELNTKDRQLETLRVHCADSNKGARINAHINRSLVDKNNALEKEREEWKELAGKSSQTAAYETKDRDTTTVKHRCEIPEDSTVCKICGS